jgi:pyridoxamine 5'-phosphate oxidase
MPLPSFPVNYDLRSQLRALPSLAGPFPPFDPDSAPADPVVLFTDWLWSAIDAGVPEPHATTLSTVDGDGRPSARVLIIKNVDGRGWQFASSATSTKGRELAAAPWAALTFYWPALGRQVRVRGDVSRADAQESAADFRNRSLGSRVVGLLGRQSQRLDSRPDLDVAIERATERITLDPELVPPDWSVYTVHPREVEFWQGDRQRRHVRLRYLRSGDEWRRELLWP